jgi:hypothetical protein
MIRIFSILSTLFIGLLWVIKGPTDQELLANVSKAIEFNPLETWWCSDFLGGTTNTSGLSTLGVFLILKVFTGALGITLGAKISALLGIMVGGIGAGRVTQLLTKSKNAGAVTSVAYILGPQASQRIAENEHLTVVFAMMIAPWVIYYILKTTDRFSFSSSLKLSIAFSLLLITFTKLGVLFTPFLLLAIIYQIITSKIGCLKTISVGLGVGAFISGLVLLPSITEMGYLSMFKSINILQFQNILCLKTLSSWVDRGGAIHSKITQIGTYDKGAFYLGVCAILTSIIGAFAIKDKENKIAMKLSLSGILLATWLSAGPVTLWKRFVEIKEIVPDWEFTIMICTGVVSIIWIYFVSPNRWGRNIKALLFLAGVGLFWGVSLFKILEKLTVFQNIRAPWSYWQIGGSLFLAILLGVGTKKLTSKKAGLFVIGLLIIVDYGTYLNNYSKSKELPNGVYQHFVDSCNYLKQQKMSGRICCLSTKYIYLQSPSLTGMPLETEAFNNYFSLIWRYNLQMSLATSSNYIKEKANLLGIRYFILDRAETGFPSNVVEKIKKEFKECYSNRDFVIYENTNAYYPGFFGEVVVAQKAPCSLDTIFDLASKGVLTTPYSSNKQIKNCIGDIAESGVNINENKTTYRIESADGIFSRNKDKVALETEKTNDGYLCLSSSYFKYWQPYIDKEKKPLEIMEGCFPCVFVPSGKHLVEFKYEPPTWYLKSVAGGLFILLILIVTSISIRAYSIFSLKEGQFSGK